MTTKNRYAEYDKLASIYDEQGTERHDIVVGQLEKLVLQYLPKEAHILDVCCGTGQIAQRLLQKGYRVTGIDGSEEMLHYARKNAPNAEFILEDARYFQFLPTFGAVISTDVGLNLITTIEELQSVFQNVYQALLKNGIFVFDLYVEELCIEDWQTSKNRGEAKDNHAWISQFDYNTETKIGCDRTTRFELIDGQWQRFNMTFKWKLYSVTDIKSALDQAGFTDIVFSDIKNDFGVESSGHVGCFIARKV
ncbi:MULTISPECIES: class I SAM-dependent DNA methyltransferase [unclassified Tolypothrix]|uniref:class I SAM-dependent DNA methyltransferase n=1 Tax=unclassified Tolypothrix TaxID=2649714 RepID=UPI0005EAAC94|nr:MULTISPECIES: class I SAM-dependent methyltransferase [unclassified Tolypothrix]BAY91145.1 type 12 methyltransferase [Microchaete diplosiphon NIES-3275]EKE99926.1 SAM-dependent methyltransferase [Tolypothrix sp. PCC 7601]MBE9081414.1 methyltransferase domain-containing protein [Tolypothrix sp. LEGE 11397]UYD25234.1 methyltransferase domain-containing protein [Tolypothrix sp. PCC 7712]UYD32527.1 methyltransferase domain-containing protein [Tolypothrix sp. PCC 7601]